LEDSTECWRIILKWVFKERDGGMDWIDLAQDRDGRWAFMKAVENLCFSKKAGNLLTT
jgi:hypothetical protein